MDYIFILYVLIIIAVVFLIFSRFFQKSTASSILSTSYIPQEGYDIPLIGSSRSFIKFPSISVAHNQLFPKLVVCSDKVKFRVIYQYSKRYDEIGAITVGQAFNFVYIQISFKDSSLYFNATPRNKEDVKKLILLFKEKGVTVSKEATDYLANNS